MINNEKTLSDLGYNIESLTRGSSKKVYIVCDYCNSIYNTSYKMYLNSRKVIEKDACKKCRYEKRKDVSLKLYGVENSSQRPDVRKKISENCEGFDDKRRETMIKKYGVDNPMNNDELKIRQQKTIINKYGVENISQSKDMREKVENTNLKKFGHKHFLASEEGKQRRIDGVQKKYGVDNVFQSEEIKEKIRRTNIEKYGVEYPMQSEEIHNKKIITNIKKYGVSTPLQNDDIKAIIRENNINKYGTEFPSQCEEVKQKTINTNIEKYGCNFPIQNKDINNKVINTKIKNGQIRIIDGKNMEEWAKNLDKPYSTLIAQISKYGFDVAIKMQNRGPSSLEQCFKIWLDSIDVKYIHQFNIENRYADFLLPDYNIIVELDGLYWHCDLFLDNKYHFDKHELYSKHSYRSFFFREDEIENKFNIVQSILNNAMHKNNNKVFARKCKVIKLSRNESDDFFNTNHLMGSGSGVSYGLEYDNKIVSAISIKNTKKQDKNYEISRFCNIINTSVIGGFSRLLSHFINDSDVDCITTFIDRRYGIGLYLENLDFKRKSCNASFKWTNTKETFHRLRFPGNSGYDNGLMKIWDCGQLRYDKKIQHK